MVTAALAAMAEVWKGKLNGSEEQRQNQKGPKAEEIMKISRIIEMVSKAEVSLQKAEGVRRETAAVVIGRAPRSCRGSQPPSLESSI